MLSRLISLGIILLVNQSAVKTFLIGLISNPTKIHCNNEVFMIEFIIAEVKKFGKFNGRAKACGTNRANQKDALTG